MNEAFIMKLIQAKRLEKEAFKELLPEEVTKHTEVIEQELKAMAMELLSDEVKNVFDVYMKAKATASCEYSNTDLSSEEETENADSKNADGIEKASGKEGTKTVRRTTASKTKKTSHVRAISIE